MKTYLVGGAVRDLLVGVEPKDRDYVVVGSTPEEMLSLGFKQVGVDFPVFLHPETKEEYALARTERKSGTGYNGFICDFNPNVTLEDDLMRRDLTINSMAIDLDTNELIDPFNGESDLRSRILRHTSDAFTEDPVRVLRLARFQAQFGSRWDIAETTCRLVRKMYQRGEMSNLTAERVWKETEKALKTQQPSLYFQSLRTVGIFPEYTRLAAYDQRKDYHPEGDVQTHTDMVMDYAARNFNDPEITFAAFCHDLGKPIAFDHFGKYYGHELYGIPVVNDLCDRLKVPKVYRELALMATKYHTKLHSALDMKPASIMKLFEETAAIKKPERFRKFLKVCKADVYGRGFPESKISYPQYAYMDAMLSGVLSVDVKEIAAQSRLQERSGKLIGDDIRLARLIAIKRMKEQWDS